MASLSAVLLLFHVSSIVPLSSPLLPLPLPLLLPHSLLMAQMWWWHTGSSLHRRQHKAVISIFKHFGRRFFHVICNQTSVELLKLTMLLVRQFPLCTLLGENEEEEEEEWRGVHALCNFMSPWLMRESQPFVSGRRNERERK